MDLNPSPREAGDGPCRETASTVLDGLIRHHKEQVLRLEHLRKVTALVEVDSPAEQLLWDMLTALRAMRQF